MKRRVFLVVSALIWLGGVWLGAVAFMGPQAGSAPTAPSRPQPAPPTAAAVPPAAIPGRQGANAATPAELTAVVDRYCVTCHSDRLKTGGLTLQGIDFADMAAYAEALEKVERKLLVRAMPPLGMPRPDQPTLDRLRQTIQAGLDAHAATHPDPGRAPLRRLNRTEYAYAIRDLLDLEVDVASVLPPDDSSYGFDNIADALTTSPALIERYLTAARQVSAVAVGDAAEISTVARTYPVRGDLSQEQHIEGLPFGTRGGILVEHTFPLDAEYTFQIDLMKTSVDNPLGMEYPHTLVLTVDGEEKARATFGGEEDLKLSFADTPGLVEKLAKLLTFRAEIKAGRRQIGVAFVEKGRAVRSGVLQPFLLTTFEPTDYTGVPHVRVMTVTGPFNPTGPGDTPSRRRIFECRPAGVADEEACAARILSRIATRAYRRPLTADERGTLLAFFRQGRTKPQGSFDTGIEMGVRRILASPSFVLRIEGDAPGTAAGALRPVTDVELASRLSFFLWSSGPDDELLRLATEGRLRRPGELERQVRRMIADPRSDALIDNFMGQWLYLRNLRGFIPDLQVFPNFNHNLRTSMLAEINLFLGSIIREDRSVLDMLTASDTFLNERLARHYGIPGVYGDHMRRVTLTQDERKGLFGKAAILAVTSYPTRTSPVLRGKWILENIFGTPPPPPPDDVPALTENAVGEAPKTLRARMEAHRANPTCAACHRVMDPIGFSLENFDAVGRWRTRDAGAPIDTGGQLMDGSRVAGPASLRAAVMRNPEVFVRTMTEKLMIYALGRGLGALDMPVLRQVTARAAGQDYRFSSLVLGIVNSVPFQMRATPAAAAETAQAAVPR